MCKFLLKTLLVMIFLVTVVVAAMAVTTGERSLLDLATTVTTTDGWEAHCHHDFDWYWLSDQEVLFARNNEGAGPTIYYKRNVVTGKETKLSILSKAMNGIRYGNRIDISPDKNWALVYNRNTEVRTLVALNGSRRFTMSYKGRFLTWLADSRHFLTVKEEDKPQRNHTVYLSDIYHPASVALNTLYSSLSIQDIYGLKQIGDHFLAVHQMASKANTVVIYQCGYDRNTSVHHNIIARLSPGAKIEYALLSPRADKIIYALDIKKTLPPPSWPTTRAQVNSRAQKEVMEVWVSNIQGQHLHRIGAIEKDRADREAIYFPLGLEWLPGGKAICVDYRWTLYTVSVE